MSSAHLSQLSQKVLELSPATPIIRPTVIPTIIKASMTQMTQMKMPFGVTPNMDQTPCSAAPTTTGMMSPGARSSIAPSEAA
jgi:hypothetical protein